GKIVWETEGIGPVYYPSKHVELSGERAKRFPATVDRWHTETIKSLRDSGVHLLKTVIEHSHEMGIEVHIGCRPQLTVMSPPMDEVRTGQFFLEHPEFHCIDRDGKRVPRISYAFSQVQQHLFRLVEEWLEFGADGACLLFNRGVPVMLYEKPIVEAFLEQHGK